MEADVEVEQKPGDEELEREEVVDKPEKVE